MNSVAFVRNEVRWSDSEKKVARKAFDHALQRQCGEIKTRLTQMLSRASQPVDLWDAADYLSEQRRRVGAVYDYRYSRLLEVFAALLSEGWLHEDDLAGLSEDKIATIKRWANC